MEEFTYEQIRVKALKQGVKDNKVHIGLWYCKDSNFMSGELMIRPQFRSIK